MRTIHLDTASTVPAYQQIVNGLRTRLVAGEFRPGDRLPPVRQLAVDLGVHHNTVAESYRALAVEGWLELRHGRKARVAQRPEPRAEPGARAGLARELEQIVAKAVGAGVRRAAAARELEQLATRLRSGV